MAKKEKKSSLWQEFKAFISRGNVLDMAVGVVIGGAFGAIVTAVVNILLSVCTFWVPGGIKGLVTVLPACTAAQKGVAGIGQKFAAADLVDATKAFAASQGKTIDVNDSDFIQWQNALLTKYTLKGKNYICNMSATIDWGTLINAIISFIIIAITLFVIVKTVKTMREKRAMLMDVEARATEKQEKNIPLTKKEKAALEAKAQREAEEAEAAAKAAAEAEAEANKPDPVVELLKEIRDSLKK